MSSRQPPISMARVMELFVIVNALAGIATFLGVRFVWRRSKDVTKRGFDVIHDRKQEDEEWTQEPIGTDSDPSALPASSQSPLESSSRPSSLRR